MKRILDYILLFSIMLLTVSCKDASTSPTESAKNYSVSGIVFDMISSDYSPGLKKGVLIYFGNDSTVSDNEGKFVFNKISPGNHTINVTLANYEPYSKTIFVSKDTSVTIYLFGIKDNYFPIQENSQKKYKYYSSVGNAVYSWADSGEATWAVSSAQLVGNSKVYDVFEKKIFTHKTYAPLYSERIDSSFATFNISESNNNIISFKSSVLDGVSFNRSIDPRLEQGGIIILNFNNPGSLISTVNVSLKKNVGLFKIVKFGQGWGETYELIQ